MFLWQTIDFLDNLPKYSYSIAICFPSCVCVLESECVSVAKSFKCDY